MKLGQLGVIITTSLDNEVGQELASIASTTTSKDLHYHIQYHNYRIAESSFVYTIAQV